jgi:polar amino acid transport system permease protein
LDAPRCSSGEVGTNFDFSIFRHFLFYGPILDGVKVTIILAVLSQAAGIVLGLFSALGRISPLKPPIFRWITGFYIWLFRGTPLLVQLAFVYFAVPQLTKNHLLLNEFWSAAVALSLNEGAYMTEIIRAGITSVPAGQMEAAQSLGMTRWLAMRRIILPQAIRFVIPPTGNEFISMLKNTSLAVIIGANELFWNVQQVYDANFRYFELLSVASVWYLAMTTVATYIQSHIERYYERGYTREFRQPGFMQRVMVGALRRG